LEEYKDYFTTVPAGNYKGQRLVEQVSVTTYIIAKRISVKAGITKRRRTLNIRPGSCG
jgi:hypothetical protein